MGDVKRALEYDYFPSPVHAIVWRNWNMVSAKTLGQVLETSEENINSIGKEMGLSVPASVNRYWLERGYITIIRQNWHLLTIDQLLILLGWDLEKLQYTLKEDDFLYHKLGYFKPVNDKVTYGDYSDRGIEFFKKALDKHFPSPEGPEHKPFEFLENFKNRNTDYEGPLLKVFSKRFVEKAEKVWGTSFECYFGKENDFAKLTSDGVNIHITIKESGDLPAESHKISIKGREVFLESVDERGVLRGLNWILKYYKETDLVIRRKTRFEIRYIYSYFAVYGDPLMDRENDPYPDTLLEKLSDMGVNGIWLQAVLYSLVPWDGNMDLSTGWERRIEGLRALVKRARYYGIGVYLYLNEPRAMPEEFFKKYPHWKGEGYKDLYSMCTSVPEIREYLYNSSRELFRMVPDLEGVFTITMSENHTNCYSHIGSEGVISCPRCREKSQGRVIAEVNNIIGEGIFSVKPEAKVIAWMWGWNPSWSDEAIALLDKRIMVMCTSEEAMETNVGGIKGRVIDYTLSMAGPGSRATKNWNKAREMGHKTVAKVQFNNTWECSAVPFMPVMNTLDTYMRNLVKNNINGLMLSWTLGGYPSLNIEYSSRFWFDDGTDPDLLDFAGEKYFENGKEVARAWEAFSEAFAQFPFHVGTLYTAPQNYGPMNIFHGKPTGYKATMIGFPYDDLDSWKSIYPAEVFEEQFRKLTEKWLEGIKLLEGITSPGASEELYLVAKGAYCHFRSTYNQVRFVRLRDGGRKDEILKVIDDELDTVLSLYHLICQDSRIGYEASNHYYYTENALKEKVINLEYLKGEICERKG